MLLDLHTPMRDTQIHEVDDDEVESGKGTFWFFFLFPLPKLGREVQIHFFQGRSGSCDVMPLRPLSKLLCWSVDHPVSTSKITTSPWNNFSLLYLKAGAQRSSFHFLAGMSVLNTETVTQERPKQLCSYSSHWEISSQEAGEWLPTSFEQGLQDGPMTPVTSGRNSCQQGHLRTLRMRRWWRGRVCVNTEIWQKNGRTMWMRTAVW